MSYATKSGKNCHKTSRIAKVGLEEHARPPAGIRFYASLGEIHTDSGLSTYAHLLTKAWLVFELSGVVCVDNIPTLYLRCFTQPLEPEQTAEYHRQFWNQGVATIFVLVDPLYVRLYSGLAIPAKPDEVAVDEKSLIEILTLTEYAQRLHEFYLQLATGQYYRDHSDKFDPQQSVDAYLLDNLAAIRDALTTGNNKIGYPEAHAFLARVLFTCYLIDRGIIDLARYKYCACESGTKLVDLLEPLKPAAAKDVLCHLFDDLKEKFNGSMFDYTTPAEKDNLQAGHIELLIKFLRGHEVRKNQLSLGFWAYDFKWIPVETISAIYEDFLAKEDRAGKEQAGAFYTPRFLAETVLDVAVQGDPDWQSKRFLDPSCGSGIFLVALFNRLAMRWQAEHPQCSYEEKAEALLGIMRDRLCGIDTSRTACRIACFSIYLAFLDRFDPPDIVKYVERTGRKLPRILQSADAGIPEPDFPVIREDDFLTPVRPLSRRFGYIVGNPPWKERGSKQIAQHFTLRIPEHLDPHGRACILLPSKVLFNKTANRFQEQWLQSITLEKIVQLADYRFILFKNAICPSIIARFTANAPDTETQAVEYETPKVRRIDLRKGIIPVAPADRKRIPLRELLHAASNNKVPIIWKQHLWGTPRDLKFLRHLLAMPQLGEHVDVLSELRRSGKPRTKRWVAGQGFKPYKKGKILTGRSLTPLDWPTDALFISPRIMAGKFFPQPGDCVKLSGHLSKGDFYPDRLYSKPPEELFTPPLILINQGFTVCSFFGYPIRFQHSLQSIAGPPEDEDLLLFLALYLRSKLARYFLFHTAANWGTERDKVHLDELLRLPFPLPGSEDAPPDADELVRSIADKARTLKKKIEQESATSAADFPLSHPGISLRREQAVLALQAEAEGLIYRYFDLIDQEIMLIEDTVEVFIKSATPSRADKPIPTQMPIHRNNLPIYSGGLAVYADTLTETLNTWAKQATGTVRVSASGGTYDKAGLAMITLDQTARAGAFKKNDISAALGVVLAQLQRSSIQPAGRLDYLRGIIWFDETRIRIVKPWNVEYWTKTAALNDAAEIYARIAKARQVIEWS